ncbi:hypothetical protein FPV67DRAFT_1558205 [Lyophyllum atratum]|nr:hypothetical protein FPV67DRAFT_1558205 [Lyophyllum atratum]
MDARINLQREHVRRVVLEIDFSGNLWGYTEITIVPTSKELRTVYLNSRQCTIHTVTVAGHQADFTHSDPLTNITMGLPNEAQDCHRHPELKRKLYAALQEGDEGELAIAIPREVPLKQSGHLPTGAVFSEAATPEPQTPGFTQSQTIPEFSPITINIAYSLRNPVDGFEFVLPTDSYPYRVPHAYTSPSSPDAARCWVPCVDNMWEKCTWEFEFVVPRYLEEQEVDQDEEEQSDATPTLVICSGDLVEQVAHPYNSNKTIFLFSQSVLTSVQHIAFAAGPFHLHTIPADGTADDVSGAVQPLMHAFCLPGHENLLPITTGVLRQAMTFYSTEFGSYPFGSYKVVFVEELPTQRFDSSTFSILTTDLLHGDDAIEQALETRQVLAHALACQWAGINILPKNWSDTWLVNGLSLYITGLFLRKLLGNNEYRFRLKKDMQRVLEWDIGSMPPICQPQVLEPPDSATLPFINLKAPLVLHILDRRTREIGNLFLSAISGEMQNNALSTHAFLRICRKVSGVDPRSFAEQWIYGSGCPSFGFSATFNRKKMAVEITMRQGRSCRGIKGVNEASSFLRGGQMTIRIHEADGTPYEHVLDIRSAFKRYEYKRVRRNTKRYLARQAAAQAAADGDTEAAEAMGMVDMGFGLEVWEKESERENWKVADWTEEDEGTMSGATYEWIRMDADFEWIANIKFDQPDFMWVSQLQRDRDVVAQVEAINALAEKPTAIVSSTFAKTVLVSNYYFRIRSEAALALVNCAIRKLDFLGLFHLFKLFLRYCYEPEDTNQDLFAHTYVPKPNEFSDFAEYFVRKNLINAISRVRFENGKSPSIVRQFLIDQLRYNDNTANPVSFIYTLTVFTYAQLFHAAASATMPVAPPERGELLPSEVRNEQNAEDVELLKQSLAEVDRYRSMDRLIPSPHNCVTIAALEFYMLLGIAGLIPNSPAVFFPLTREGNYTQVRIAAFDGLFLTKWYTPHIMRYVLAVMANDPSKVIRRHVARSACHSLALLVQMGEMKSGLKETESLLIEEDGTLPEKAKESKKSELDIMIKVLRKDREVGKNEVLREFLMPIALAPDVDQEVRWCILKLADILIRPVEEAAPTVKIHIPSTPVTDTARTLKSGGPHPRLRLPASPMPQAGPQTPATPRIESSKKNVAFIAPPPPIPKGKQASHVPKAQSGGMTLNDLTASRNAWKKLTAHKHALAFKQPVDPIRDQAPKYFDIIKDPMDLSTMRAKLEEGMYKDRFAFEADFRLMISNSQLYNAPGSFVHNAAIALETFFEKRMNTLTCVCYGMLNQVAEWTIITKTLEAADKSHAPATVPAAPQRAPRILPPVPRAFPTPPPPAPAAPVAALARPTIKLKVGSQPKPADTPEQVVAKPRARKPKAEPPSVDQPPVEPPPPPYVDDGSHDILQEVLAIEREKDEKRHRSTSEKEKDKQPRPHWRKKRTNSPSMKSDALSEDDIVALAKPSKKERPSPPGPSSSTVPKVKLVVPSTVKPVPSSHKSKADKQAQPVVTPDVPRVSLKGKEKEVSSPAPPPPAPKPKKRAHPTTPINEKKCKDLMKVLQRLPEAGIFSRPVDPVADGCPTYLQEISHPMDFGTITTKLNQNKYLTTEEFGADIELVFSNCRRFNPPATFPVTCTDVVEKAFKKEWPKVLERKLSWMEKRGLQGVMTSLVKEEKSWVFREPVDPVLLGIPTYYDIIPKKNARDLRTIRQKLDADKYDTVEAFVADIELMLSNAITFNGPGSEVADIAIIVRSKFNELMESWRSGSSKKRKDGDKGTPQPMKKAKLG